MPKKYGWFRYARNPSGAVGKWTIARLPHDPPIVVWRVGEDEWIVDDDAGDQHVQVDGFTEAEIRAALAFAQVMGWIAPEPEPVFRELSQTD